MGEKAGYIVEVDERAMAVLIPADFHNTEYFEEVIYKQLVNEKAEQMKKDIVIQELASLGYDPSPKKEKIEVSQQNDFSISQLLFLLMS